VPEEVKSRSYRSAARRDQARATRRRILQAAATLFTQQGYAETTVAQVAERASVSVDTLYASVGRKPQILLAVHDMALGSADEPIPALQRDYVAAVRRAEGARAKITLYAEALGRIFPAAVPLSDALRIAGLGDPECRAVWEALNERRAANMLLFAADLRATGEIRADLTDDDVAQLVWSMNSPEYYLLVTSRGRTPEQYAALVADVWTRTLLA
jgi:AcrR family transcriptional regulator